MSMIRYCLLLFLFLSLNPDILGQNKSNFTRLSVKTNGGKTRINQALEDDNKRIWMIDGQNIFIYDGYSYSSISLRSIYNGENKTDRLKKIIKDSDGNIWILTTQGLLINRNQADQFEFINFNRTKNEFSFKVKEIVSFRNQIVFADFKGGIFALDNKTYAIDKLVNETNSTIEEIVFNQSNIFFYRTEFNEVFAFSFEKRVVHKLNRSFKEFSEKIVFQVDKDDYLWIATWGRGIYRFKFKNGAFQENTSFKNILRKIDRNVFISIFCDSSNNLYLGTDGDGLYKLDLNKVVLDHFKNNPVDPYSLSTNTISSINEDSCKNLWVLTNYGNVNILPNKPNNIDYYSGSASDSPVRVLSIYKSKANILWIGTSGEGVTKINLKNGKSKSYAIDKNSKKGLFAFAIEEDEKHNIWVGTYQNGLWLYNRKDDIFSKISKEKEDLDFVEEIRFIYKDSLNRIWVSSNSSLDVYNSSQVLLARFPINSYGLKGSNSQGIVEDMNHNLWVVYIHGGLFKFIENKANIQSSIFTEVPLPYNDQDEILAYESMSIFENDLWLIKKGKLYRYNIELDELTDFSYYNSLFEVSLKMVKVEDKNNIWLSSNRGIWHLNAKDSVTNNYHLSHGFQTTEFMNRSAFKDNMGKFYFGGTNGLNAFYPRDLRKTKTEVALNINSIEVLNKPINMVIPEQIKEGVENIEKLKLEYDQSSISFKFSAIGNILNPNYFYAYKLDGLDEDWIYTENELKATYTSLPPGTYKFKLKAGTKSGIWDLELKEIKIEVKDPLWLSPWAYLLYGVLVIIVLISVKRWSLLRTRLYKEGIKNNNEKKLHQLKMDFFTKMSHEIQTPLMLILGSIERLFKTALNDDDPSILKQRLRTIYNNANRLSRITSNLTMARNSELGILKLKVFKDDIIVLLKEIAFSFEDHANSKNIDFKINFSTQKLELWYDRDKIEHILYNLLSNAFKFTPKSGKINFDVNLKKEFIEISISNSGKPILKKELNKIFNMFYQSKFGKNLLGSGIGLSLSKELIELHRGTINVTSNSETTCFKFEIPFNDVYLKDEKLETQKTRLGQYDFREKEFPFNKDETTKDMSKKDRTILIVEDNYELQLFLLDVFKNNYNVIIAEDGIKGLEYAKQYMPNLILSDIIMPGIDGIELCKKVLANKSISHIPFVLMTAENNKNIKLDGLKTGAVEFIHKPFNVSELALKIRSIISSGEQIRDKYKRELISVPRVDIAKSDDELLLHKIALEVESEIQNVDFNLLKLANKLKMSQTTLYRKCHALTGRTLVEFVRLIKLKKAAIILCKHEYSISETAYMVGFNDSKYFSKCFKKEFKVSPITFRKLSKGKGIEEFLKKYNLNDVV